MDLSIKNNNLIAADLFSGAGGFSLAAIKSGFNISFSIENDKYSAATYRKNICKNKLGGKTTLYEQNIVGIDPKKIAADHFLNTSCDLLLGGPPCQGFSSHRILDAGVNDPRNELIISYFEFVKALQPKVFLMENVPGMLWPRHKPYLDRFFNEGEKSGYKLYDPVILDARDYGVPQRRRRVFVLGVHPDIEISDFTWPPKASHTNPKNQSANNDMKPWVSCSEVFQPADKSDPNDLHMQHGPTLTEVFSRTPANGGSRKDSGRILPCHKNYEGHKDVYGRINPFEPAPTMTTGCINPSKGRFVHPTENHGITMRQAARIQTFPDDFIFEGGITAASRQIGNAVPVELGKLLIQHIKSLLQPDIVEVKGISNSDLTRPKVAQIA